MKLFVIIALIIGAFLTGSYLVKPASCGAACEKQILTMNAFDFNKMTNEKNITIIDVRTPEEYKEGHIENSVNADFYNRQEFNKLLGSLDKNGKYLVYCRSGNRSGQALSIMEEMGFSNVTNLDDGILSWQSSGFPLVTP